MKYTVILVSGDHVQYLDFEDVRTVTTDETSYILLGAENKKLCVAPISKVFAIYASEE